MQSRSAEMIIPFITVGFQDITRTKSAQVEN